MFIPQGLYLVYLHILVNALCNVYILFLYQYKALNRYTYIVMATYHISYNLLTPYFTNILFIIF